MAESQSREKRISRGTVAIYKDLTGRGPTHVKTELTDSAAMTICTQSLTKAERRLVDKGEAQTVRDLRRKFQDAMREDYIAMVEGITDRTAATFLSDHDATNDVSIEVVTFAESNGQPAA